MTGLLFTIYYSLWMLTLTMVMNTLDPVQEKLLHHSQKESLFQWLRPSKLIWEQCVLDQ